MKTYSPTLDYPLYPFTWAVYFLIEQSSEWARLGLSRLNFAFARVAFGSRESQQPKETDAAAAAAGSHGRRHREPRLHLPCRSPEEEESAARFCFPLRARVQRRQQ
jgi:hypothetical protein